MVKKKGAREMNPADAHRKAQRAKEIARNKKERKFQRDAYSMQTNPEAIKDELKEVLALEEDGKGNQTVRLKRKALQGAYDTALKKKKEEELRKYQPMDELSFSNQGGHGVLERRPEDSVYYHPTLNPTGVPPPGKPQRYKTSVAAATSSSLAALPKPKPPPLPAGPAPRQPGNSAAEPGQEGGEAGQGPLPPPAGPPPGSILPPPSGPPPGIDQRNANGAGPMPPPVGPPPGYRPGMMMPPPQGPPPGMPPMQMPPQGLAPGGPLPPPHIPPPGYIMPPPAGPPPSREPKESKPTIQAASTVVRMPRADQDKRVTSMVPASLRVRRDAGSQPKKASFSAAPSAAPRVGAPDAAPDIGDDDISGFGMAHKPVTIAPEIQPRKEAMRGRGFDSKYEDFMHEMAGLGALNA